MKQKNECAKLISYHVCTLINHHYLSCYSTTRVWPVERRKLSDIINVKNLNPVKEIIGKRGVFYSGGEQTRGFFKGGGT